MTLLQLPEVIEHNLAQQRRARSLNARAGANLLPVLNADQISTWLSVQLAGARRCAEITNFEALKLPPLDEELIAQVERHNPSTIALMGRSCQVEYPKGARPLVQLVADDDFVRHNQWQQLPDSGVKLPGGRLVEVSITLPGNGGTIISQTDIVLLKLKLRKRLKQEHLALSPQPVGALDMSKLAGAFGGNVRVTRLRKS
jgi:hypothetical protein